MLWLQLPMVDSWREQFARHQKLDLHESRPMGTPSTSNPYMFLSTARPLTRHKSQKRTSSQWHRVKKKTDSRAPRKDKLSLFPFPQVMIHRRKGSKRNRQDERDPKKNRQVQKNTQPLKLPLRRRFNSWAKILHLDMEEKKPSKGFDHPLSSNLVQCRIKVVNQKLKHTVGVSNQPSKVKSAQ